MPIYPQKQGIYIERGDTYIEQFNLGVDVTGKQIVFTLKASKYVADSAARVQVTSDQGLVILLGAVAADPTQANIVVNSLQAGTVTLTIEAAVTTLLESEDGNWYYDFQVIEP